jgi:hypothetical protein
VDGGEIRLSRAEGTATYAWSGGTLRRGGARVAQHAEFAVEPGPEGLVNLELERIPVQVLVRDAARRARFPEWNSVAPR